MAKDLTFNKGEQLPAYWLNQIQELLGGMQPLLRIVQPSNTSLRIVAGTGNAYKGLPVEGLFRYIQANQEAAHPGGAAGVYDILVMVSANTVVSTPEPYTDTTDYNFYLKIVKTGEIPTGNTPGGKAIAATRKIGEVYWDGAKITGFVQLVGSGDTTMPLQPEAPAAISWGMRVVAAAAQTAPIFIVTNNAKTTNYFEVTTGGIKTTGNGEFNANVTVGGTLTVSGAATLGAGSTAITQSFGDSTTKIATTAFVANAISGGVGGFAPLASPTFTGTPVAPTPTLGDNSTKIATTAFVTANTLTTASAAATYETITGAASTYAPLASPALTGKPTAPTAAAGTNTTQLATTAFVAAAIGEKIFEPGDLKATVRLAGPGAGWLKCEGQAVNRTTYKALWEALGEGLSPWGLGNGATTFNLPDYRERVMLGPGLGSGGTNPKLGEIGGEWKHTLTEGEMPKHHHGAPYATGAGGTTSGTGIPPHNNLASGGSWQDSDQGESLPHNNAMPYTVCQVWVKT